MIAQMGTNKVSKIFIYVFHDVKISLHIKFKSKMNYSSCDILIFVKVLFSK